MVAIKKIKRILFALFCFVCFAFCFSPAVGVSAESNSGIYLGGFPAGFVLNTQNVEVIGLSEIDTEQGSVCPARDGGILTGDIIRRINGVEITSVNKLTSTLNEDYAVFNFEIERGEQCFKTQINPIKGDKDGKKHFGMLVRDNLNGIGTVTYINGNDMTFGSLGHPVADVNGKLLEINGGTLFGCSIYDVKKGLRGNPGELKGIFDNATLCGKITKNSSCGIYGNVADNYDFSNLKRVAVGKIGDVEMGKAHIYSTLYGSTCEEYEISIIKIDENNKENKNFVIKVNDERVLERAGGIVQGMSGSPIVQNGKIVGAITHVFINDPTRGYGIAIENMLQS